MVYGGPQEKEEVHVHHVKEEEGAGSPSEYRYHNQGGLGSS